MNEGKEKKNRVWSNNRTLSELRFSLPTAYPRVNFRKVILILMVAFGSFSLASVTLARAKKKNAEKKSEIQEIKVQNDVQKNAQNNVLIQQAQEKLNNSQWQIKLFQLTPSEKNEVSMDTLKFSDNKVVSAKLLSKGFSATSYALSLKGENIVIWETMQTNLYQDMVLFKGEIEGEMMRGVLSQQPKNKPVTDYSFVSISRESIKEEKAAMQKIESQKVLEETQTDVKKEMVLVVEGKKDV